MKVNVPQNINDITLGQFQELLKLSVSIKDPFDLNCAKIALFTKLTTYEARQINDGDFNLLVSKIDTALRTDGDFKTQFLIRKKTFGFIPNFDEISAGENANLQDYTRKLTNVSTENLEVCAESFSDMHKIMAILYRPVTNRDAFGNYKIEAYRGTKYYAETMKETPLSYVKGALGFFLSLFNDLESYILKSMKEAIQKEELQLIISRNLDGTLP